MRQFLSRHVTVSQSVLTIPMAEFRTDEATKLWPPDGFPLLHNAQRNYAPATQRSLRFRTAQSVEDTAMEIQEIHQETWLTTSKICMCVLTESKSISDIWRSVILP